MKAFICSSVILALMLTLIILNAVVMTEKIDQLASLAEQAQNSPAVIEAIDSLWQDCRDFISFSVYRDELERVERAIISAQSYSQTSTPDYSAAVAELIAALEHIRESQQFSFSNIF